MPFASSYINFRYSNATLMEGLIMAKAEGLVDAVGVSNYSAAQTEEASEILEKSGVCLASNQARLAFRVKNRVYDLGFRD